MAARLGDEDEDVGLAAEAVLRKECKLYRAVLNCTCALFLYMIAFRQCFDEQLSWYMSNDGHFCVKRPEHTRAFPTDNHRHDIRTVINKAQPTDFPSIGLEGAVQQLRITP